MCTYLADFMPFNVKSDACRTLIHKVTKYIPMLPITRRISYLHFKEPLLPRYIVHEKYVFEAKMKKNNTASKH